MNASNAPTEATVASLYAELQPQLERILNVNLQPPVWVIDDASQTAWGLLIEHRDAVEPGRELAWLATTATRAALRLMRGWRGGVATELSDDELAEIHLLVPGPHRQVEIRERIAEVRRLPTRQQRLVMLRGFGYGYDEIAAATGASRRTVARQLARARQNLLGLAREG